jgi:hypothetical protein
VFIIHNLLQINKLRYCNGLIAALVVFAGCSSQQSVKPVMEGTKVAVATPAEGKANFSSDAGTLETFAEDSSYNEVTAQMLERARQHYLSALSLQECNDSTQSAFEFESAIGILNELAYYPSIDTNKDFNDLSHSVVEDYEKYIASIDSLGAQTSIFALREKLNQIDEANESPDQDTPRAVIATPSIPLVVNGHVEKNIKFFQDMGEGSF